MLIVVNMYWLTQQGLKLFSDCGENPDFCAPTRDQFPKTGAKVTYWGGGAVLRSCWVLGFLGFGTPSRRDLLCGSHPAPPAPSCRAQSLVQAAMRVMAQNAPAERKRSIVLEQTHSCNHRRKIALDWELSQARSSEFMVFCSKHHYCVLLLLARWSYEDTNLPPRNLWASRLSSQRWHPSAHLEVSERLVLGGGFYLPSCWALKTASQWL